MKIAIIGAGVSGLYAAWHLAAEHSVTVYEADERLGGHADTQRVDEGAREIAIDTGFIVFNRAHYPLLSRWFDTLGVESKPTAMSFGVDDRVSGIYYNASTLNRLFCQRRNLVRPRFHGMVRDIMRFYRQAPALLESLDDRTTLGQWLECSDFGEMFATRHMLPMASALWSAPVGDVMDFPMKHLLAFMDNHAMLTLSERPPWETVVGGSRSYVEAAGRCSARFATGTPVRGVQRHDGGARVRTDREAVDFDAVVMACHSDQALSILDDASPVEHCVLSAVGYQANETVLHTDASVLPEKHAARAAWNVRIDGRERDQCQVSYYMNVLQGLDCRDDYVVSLNQTDRIDPDRILVKRQYAHPVFTPQAIAAQDRWEDINGLRRTWFCGAWWGWGFHEDGARSAQRVIDSIRARHG